MDKAYEVLKNAFQFDDFKLSQRDVIHRLLVDNENALVLYPTGGSPRLDICDAFCMLTIPQVARA